MGPSLIISFLQRSFLGPQKKSHSDPHSNSKILIACFFLIHFEIYKLFSKLILLKSTLVGLEVAIQKERVWTGLFPWMKLAPDVILKHLNCCLDSHEKKINAKTGRKQIRLKIIQSLQEKTIPLLGKYIRSFFNDKKRPYVNLPQNKKFQWCPTKVSIITFILVWHEI